MMKIMIVTFQVKSIASAMLAQCLLGIGWMKKIASAAGLDGSPAAEAVTPTPSTRGRGAVTVKVKDGPGR